MANMKEESKSKESYSPTFAFIYFFNMHLGQGIILLPKLISKTGLLLSTLLITAIAGVNFITSSHILEAMGIANALSVRQKRGLPNIHKTAAADPSQDSKTVNESADEQNSLLLHDITEEGFNDSEETLSPDDYEIIEKFEMGAMANMFYHPVAVIIYYVTICLYITGSMASMLVAIIKTLVVVAWILLNDRGESGDKAQLSRLKFKAIKLADNIKHTHNETRIVTTSNMTHPSVFIPGEFEPLSVCFGGITQLHSYYIFMSIFAVLIIPWTYIRFTTSKYLQVLTNTMRNIAFALMLGICIANLSKGDRANPYPPLADITGIPALFGVTTYSFKAQHCLPGVITPMNPKRRILLMISSALIIILGFHFVMSFTADFWLSYDELQDLYTLNFFTLYVSSDPITNRILAVCGYYIAVYPVFSLTPIIPVESIILRENLKALTRLLFKSSWLQNVRLLFTVDRILLPTIAIILPFAISFATTNIDLLISITGGVFGVWIQYLISTTLLFAGKYIIIKRLRIKYENKYKSPFSHIFFLCFIIVWTVVSAALVMAGDITKLF